MLVVLAVVVVSVLVLRVVCDVVFFVGVSVFETSVVCLTVSVACVCTFTVA